MWNRYVFCWWFCEACTVHGWSCEMGTFLLWWSCEIGIFFFIMVQWSFYGETGSLVRFYIFFKMVFWNRYIFCVDGLVKTGLWFMGLWQRSCERDMYFCWWSGETCKFFWQWTSETGTLLLWWSSETGIFSLLSVFWNRYIFCGDDLLKQVLFLYYGLVNLVTFLWWSSFDTGTFFLIMVLWNRYIFIIHGLVKQICILLMVMWSMYCLWQWSCETGTFSVLSVFWNRYIFCGDGLLKQVWYLWQWSLLWSC